MPLPPHIQVRHECLTFVVLGATGNLARVKLLPSLFNLYAAGHLPPRTLIVAAGRTDHTDRSFGDILSRSILDSWKPPAQPCGDKPSFSSSGGGEGGGGGLVKNASFGLDDLRHAGGSQSSTPTAPLTAADIGGSSGAAARSLSLSFAASPKGAPPPAAAAAAQPGSPLKSPAVPQGLIDEFLERVKYVRVAAIPKSNESHESHGVGENGGEEDEHSSLSEVFDVVARHEEENADAPGRNRIFYLALPHELYPPVANAIAVHRRRRSSDDAGWTRLVLEKPFGIDLLSAVALNHALAVDWTERELYRIDRYLGKEVIDNLLVMRFANRLLTPIWNRENVSNVQIIFKEPFGVNTGYFDSHGIIRDVLQNHLLQILAVLAMDRPVSLEPEDIRDAKLKVLRQVNRVNPAKDVVAGRGVRGGGGGGGGEGGGVAGGWGGA